MVRVKNRVYVAETWVCIIPYGAQLFEIESCFPNLDFHPVRSFAICPDIFEICWLREPPVRVCIHKRLFIATN